MQLNCPSFNKGSNQKQRETHMEQDFDSQQLIIGTHIYKPQ